MARFRQSLRLRPVKSEKHEVSWIFLAQNASTTQTVSLIDAVPGEPSGANEVEVASTVRSIYVEFNLNGVDNSGASQVFNWSISKQPANSNIAPDPGLFDTKDKRFILKRGMEMLPEVPLDSGGTVQTKRIFVVKIPPRMSRWGEDDQLILQYKATSASAVNFCGFVIFKEFK